MVFLTDRDLERLVSLRASWRKDYLDEVARLLQSNATNSPFELNRSVQVNDLQEAARLAGVLRDRLVVPIGAGQGQRQPMKQQI